MRYFLERFEEVYHKKWPFGQFPAWNHYPKTGTHVGTDFVVPVGTPVFAPTDGEMFKAEFNKQKGNVGVFIFKHKGTEWGLELCHLKELPTKAIHKEGDTIALSGNTGAATTGAHLHAVLHKDALVTKHYRDLTSREAFLRLEREGAVVDCFAWFRAAVREAAEPAHPVPAVPVPGVPIESPAPSAVPEAPSVAPPVVAVPPARRWSFSEFFRILFGKR